MQDFESLPPEIEMQIRAKLSYREYETRGDLNALNVCIQSARLIMDMTEDDSPEKADTLTNLAMPLQDRYKSMGQFQDLEEAISLARRADALTSDESPNKAQRLTTLSNSILSRFEREERPEDLEEAVRLQTHALELLPDNHAAKPLLLNNLGSSLSTRFRHLGRPDDLDKAISVQSHAVELTPDGVPHKSTMLMNLGNIQRVRFERLGNLEDIERAVVLHRQSIDLTPDGDPNKPLRLDSVGGSLHARFKRLGNPDDLAQAIQFRTHAVNMLADSHPSKLTLLSNLASGLHDWYEGTRDVRDLEKAIAYQSHAVALTPDGHPDKPLQLNKLAKRLRARAEHYESLDDLNAAITHLTTAVALTPEGHPNQQDLLYTLGNMLHRRFDVLRNTADLDEAIRHSTRSVELLPESHSERAQNLRLLGLLFRTRLRSPHAHTDDAAHAMEAFHTAMLHPNSPPLERLRASGQYTDLLTGSPHLLPPSLPLALLDAYQHAIDLVPQCLWLGNNVRRRYGSRELRSVRVVVDDAVTAAIAAEEYGLALEWLEAGHSVVWSQVLQLRTPLDDLQRDHPLLADNLRRVSQALQRTIFSATPSDAQATTKLPPNPGAQSLHSYALEYEKLITQIRKLEGFERFMRPKMLPQLSNACAGGPVVIISMHKSSCNALVLSYPANVVHVPLPEFSLVRANGLRTRLWDFLSRECLLSRWRDDLRDESGVEDRGVRRTSREAPDILRKVLAALWNEVVRPIMDVVSTLIPVCFMNFRILLQLSLMSLCTIPLCSPMIPSLMLHGVQRALSCFFPCTLLVSIPRTNMIEHHHKPSWTSLFPPTRQPSRLYSSLVQRNPPTVVVQRPS